VEKQRRLRNDPMLFSDKADPGSVPIAGVWNQPDSIGVKAHAADEHADAGQDAANDSELHGGTVLLKVGRTHSEKARIRKLSQPVSIGIAGSD
jgi:hypothetical protein